MTKMRLTHDNKGNHYEQLWFDPTTRKVFETMQQPDHGFTREIDATPIYDVSVGANNMSIIQKATADGTLTQSLVDGLPSASLDGDLTSDLDEFTSHLERHRIKEAALLSNTNPAVNVVRIYSQLYGRQDRNYAGVELMRPVATEELIMNFDKILKMEGLEQIPEMTMPREKDIAYERKILETNKYGLFIRISEESIRKNVHNPYQDSVTVAGTKVAQRKSFSVISALDNDLGTVAGVAWDTFVQSGISRSSNDPTRDITRIVTQSIEATNVGGKWDRFGIHQIGGKIYDSNTFLNGVVAPVPTAELAAGTRTTKGFDGVTMVNDNFIPQGDAFLTDVGTEATGILLEGPTRIATKIDEFLATQNYAIIDYHLAAVLNPVTGIKMTGVYTPVSPPTIT